MIYHITAIPLLTTLYRPALPKVIQLTEMWNHMQYFKSTNYHNTDGSIANITFSSSEPYELIPLYNASNSWLQGVTNLPISEYENGKYMITVVGSVEVSITSDTWEYRDKLRLHVYDLDHTHYVYAASAMPWGDTSRHLILFSYRFQTISTGTDHGISFRIGNDGSNAIKIRSIDSWTDRDYMIIQPISSVGTYEFTDDNWYIKE